MKLFAIPFVLFFLFSTAHAELDLNKKFDCTVLESNQSHVPVGTKTKIPVVLKELKNSGLILLDNPNHSFIEFYGSMDTKDLNTFYKNSRFVTWTKSTGEIQGVISTRPVSDGNAFQLNVMLTLMNRAFDPETNQQYFVLGNEAEVYIFLCTPQ
jgi:hypothetical protein